MYIETCMSKFSIWNQEKPLNGKAPQNKKDNKKDIIIGDRSIFDWMMYILRDFVRPFLLIAIIVFAVKWFVFFSASVPSSSMEPTLLTGDYIFVTRPYGVSMLSVPLYHHIAPAYPTGKDPVFAVKPILRGDIVVFKDMKGYAGCEYTKRVIGVAGDLIEIDSHGYLSINGEVMDLTFVENWSSVTKKADPNGDCVLYNTYIFDQNGKKIFYNVLLHREHNKKPHVERRTFLVPNGYVFCCGDNRNNSFDSQYGSGVGFVAQNHVIGHVVRRLISFDTNVKNTFLPTIRSGSILAGL